MVSILLLSTLIYANFSLTMSLVSTGCCSAEHQCDADQGIKVSHTAQEVDGHDGGDASAGVFITKLSRGVSFTGVC